MFGYYDKDWTVVTDASVFLVVACAIINCLRWIKRGTIHPNRNRKSQREHNSLLLRYIFPFLCFKGADWLQGAYFYEVYASKNLSDSEIAILFLYGFGASAILGPVVGVCVDILGRKNGCIAYCFFSIFAAFSTHFQSYTVLVIGRFCGGTASSILHSAPEAWLVAEHSKAVRNKKVATDGSALQSALTWSHFGNGVVAIVAGHVFIINFKFIYFYNENSVPNKFRITTSNTSKYKITETKDKLKQSSPQQNNTHCSRITLAVLSEGIEKISITVDLVLNDSHIFAVGVVQAFTEASMYICFHHSVQIVSFGTKFCTFKFFFFKVFFLYTIVLMLSAAIVNSTQPGAFPYITEIFNNIPGTNLRNARIVGSSTGRTGHLLICFFIFEGTIGLFWPAISMLRAKYLPNTCRSAAMTLFRVPLNIMVMGVSIGTRYLGTDGALACAAITSSFGVIAQLYLLFLTIFHKSREESRVIVKNVNDGSKMKKNIHGTTATKTIKQE
eukprot:GSMAST32.ASY1.ANO1.1166.1 assembled CDS